jgi:hypothetical protein
LLIDVSATTGAAGGASATSEAAGAAAGACPDLLVKEDEPSLPPHPARTAIPASARHCICNRKFIRMINPRLTISAKESALSAYAGFLFFSAKKVSRTSTELLARI